MNWQSRFIHTLENQCPSDRSSGRVDPVVFFKMLLVGYLENCCSDRALERLFQLRPDLLYFIDHDISERVPGHSTICKTRKRIPTEVFDAVFNHILGLFVQSGMVSGKIQSTRPTGHPGGLILPLSMRMLRLIAW